MGTQNTDRFSQDFRATGARAVVPALSCRVARGWEPIRRGGLRLPCGGGFLFQRLCARARPLRTHRVTCHDSVNV